MKNKYYWYLMLKNMLKYDITYTKSFGIIKIEERGKIMLEKNKKKIDKSKIFTKIIAAVMAAFMVLSICFTFIYYFVQMMSK